jgi:hypothetical protein
MYLLIIIYLLILGIAVISYGWSSRSRDIYIRLMFLYLLLIMVTSLAAIYLVKGNNLFLFHFSIPLEYVILSLIFHRYLQGRILKRIILVSIPVFLILSAVLSIYVQKLDENNSYAVGVESVAMISWSLLALRQLLSDPGIASPWRDHVFWITIAVLYSFTGNMIIEGMLNYTMHRSMDLAKRLYYVSIIFKYVFLLMLIAGCYCRQLLRTYE